MKKILIVDDYPDFLNELCYILKGHYEVLTANNVAETKEKLMSFFFAILYLGLTIAVHEGRKRHGNIKM